MNRTDRLFGIVLDLQARRIVRAEDLAARYETSLRTIYRDVTALCEAGIPVVSLPGRGYSLPPGYFLPPLSLALEEAASLVLGADYVAQTLDETYRAAARSAADKIAAIVPRALRDALERTRGSLRLLNVAPADREELERLRTARAAIDARRVVTMRYYGRRSDDAAGTGAALRRVAPYALSHVAGRWFLVGHSYERDALRRFRLSRVEDLTPTDDVFEIPPDLDLRPSERADGASVLVRVAFAGIDLRWVAERLAPFDATLEPNGTGVTASFRVRDEAGILGWLLGWGAAVRVLEPEMLRERIRAEARAILANEESDPDTTLSVDLGYPERIDRTPLGESVR